MLLAFLTSHAWKAAAISLTCNYMLLYVVVRSTASSDAHARERREEGEVVGGVAVLGGVGENQQSWRHSPQPHACWRCRQPLWRLGRPWVGKKRRTKQLFAPAGLVQCTFPTTCFGCLGVYWSVSVVWDCLLHIVLLLSAHIYAVNHMRVSVWVNVLEIHVGSDSLLWCGTRHVEGQCSVTSNLHTTKLARVRL